MRRALLVALLALAALPTAAQAHPVGNFSVNRLDVVSVSSDRVDVRHVVDHAEIPTFQERGLSKAEVLARRRAEAVRGLELTVDGARVPLVLAPGGTLTHRPGEGGLRTSRVTLRMHASVRAPRVVMLHDRTFAGRVGWKAIQAVPGRGTAVRSSVPATDPTRGLTTYPEELLRSPADVRAATLRVEPGAGTVAGPGGRDAAVAPLAESDGFTRLLEDGDGVLVLLLLAAFGWGAVHALSPGHGKTMVAAYLVGTHGRPRDAVALGITVTITHTIGVFALGFVTLALSAHTVPEDLYPWLELASGLMVLGVGGAVLRSRLREARSRRHADDHGHSHAHEHSRRGILAMGASAGLIPCPSALVVLLGAIGRHEVGLGLLLILAFSAGLAVTLTALGLLVIKAARLPARPGLARLLPAVSAVAIVVVGLLLTIQAIPSLPG